MSRRRPLVIALSLTGTVAVLTASAWPAAAQEGAVRVTNRETVQAFLTPAGEVRAARVYDQIDAFGKGSLTLENPVSTQGLRNLDGFRGYSVSGNKAVQEIEVDGEARLRTVSDFTKDIPVKITPTYRLNGEEIEAGDLVGKSGRLEVSYVVENVTSKPTEVKYVDGHGNEVVRTVDVPIPMVGQLVTVLPSRFTAVHSREASVAGDGRGGTKLSFTMTLFPPIGSDRAEFGYTAEVRDAVLPPANVTVVPVQPLQSPSFRGGAEAYQSGAESGIELTTGATEIDANLLKLRDGASELLTGLVLLRDGAGQLRDGLEGQAAPGSRELANGAHQAADGAEELATGLNNRAAPGSKELADGADKAADGAGALSNGLNQLKDGSRQLAEGLRSSTGQADLVSGSARLAEGNALIAAGLTKLAGVDGLPAALDGVQQLRFGISHAPGTLGPNDPGGLLEGLERLVAGLEQVDAGIDGLKALEAAKAGVARLRDAVEEELAPGVRRAQGALDTQIQPGIGQAKGGVDQVKAGLDDALESDGSIDQLQQGVAAASATAGCSADPVCAGILAQVAGGLEELETRSTQASAGLGQVSQGLGELDGGVGRVSDGLGDAASGLDEVGDRLGEVHAGLSKAVDGVAQLDAGMGQILPGAKALESGVRTQLLVGVQQLETGLMSAVVGVFQLEAGSQDLAAGALLLASKTTEAADGAQRIAAGNADAAAGGRDLAQGNRQLADGADELAKGLNDAAKGSRQLADGNRRIADGASELATGLDDAADGSAQLADGLGQAAEGAPQLVDGAQRLSDEGTKKLVEAGEETASDYGERYAVIEASAERAETEALPYGAPDGAIASAAYSIDIDGADGEGGRNLGRGLGALAIFAAALGITLVGRRQFG